MRLELDPMPPLRAAAEERVNAHFNRLVVDNIHRDFIHQNKRAIVRDPSRWTELATEAELSGLTVDRLVEIIASKPDEVAERELQRRGLILSIRRATTPDEIDRLLLACPDPLRGAS